MRATLAGLCLSVFLGAAVCSAQEAPPPATAPGNPVAQPDYSFAHCTGFFTDQKVPDEMRLISGEQSNYKNVFTRGDYVYISRGMNQGVQVGDRFSVVRPQSDPVHVNWFKWQNKLAKAMGMPYADLGILEVVKVYPSTSIATIKLSCAPMERGDVIRPYAERPQGPYKDAGQFDHFAPASGKPVAMVITSMGWSQAVGTRSTIYVNLGSGQGAKVGDYFRIFRYQGSRAEAAPTTKDFQFRLYGYGSTPQRYEWKDLPREVLGEGIVLHVTRNSSTVLITFASSEVYAGDYVELE